MVLVDGIDSSLHNPNQPQLMAGGNCSFCGSVIEQVVPYIYIYVLTDCW